MDRERSTDILGRVFFVAVAAFFMVKYNYEVSQFFIGVARFLWEARGSFVTDLERTFEDAGILMSIVLLIVLIIVALGSWILGLLITGVIWVIVKLNDIYVLPFILPVLVVYSKFSYAFIVKPFLWVLGGVILLFLALGRFFGRLFRLFVVLPIAEFISLRGQPAFRLYRAATSVLFMVGSLCLLVGILGVTAAVVRDKGIARIIESFVTGSVEAGEGAVTHEQNQYRVEVKASHSFWTKTGILLERGDVVSFTATGTVRCISPVFDDYFTGGPEGMRDRLSSAGYLTARRLTKSYRAKGYSPSNYILDDKAMNGLIGKVGTGEPFFVGAFKEYKAHQPGEILLGINQVWLPNAWKKNSGSFNVDILVRRR